MRTVPSASQPARTRESRHASATTPEDGRRIVHGLRRNICVL
ncbi:hypothetical protein PH213_27270 [Streptomyces sp. SRF1]|nr:hypothetical protein [Streptomyces sp. SRF1]MDN3058194.1 hypothetical protein [Streptomyces sp. SRF1]